MEMRDEREHTGNQGNQENFHSYKKLFFFALTFLFFIG